MVEFNFKELTAKAHFDYVGPNFPKFLSDRLSGDNNTYLPSLKGIGLELLNGGVYFMQLELGYNSETFKLPNEPIIGLSLSKTIVETATVGKYRKGNVKEYISTEDYQISIKGICFNEDDPEVYPTDQVETLNTLFAINDSVQVLNNAFFELFGIRDIVLKDISFDEMVGQQGLQKYTISAVSDQDFYADLNDRNANQILNG